MKELIEALQIFVKYGNSKYPTQCEHDELIVHGYKISNISHKDIQKLYELGFNWSDEYSAFYSTKFGSC